MLVQMALFHSFFTANIPLYVCVCARAYAMSPLSIHLSVDIQVASMPWLL